jgi:hypothetical protein
MESALCPALSACSSFHSSSHSTVDLSEFGRKTLRWSDALLQRGFPTTFLLGIDANERRHASTSAIKPRWKMDVSRRGNEEPQVGGSGSVRSPRVVVMFPCRSVQPVPETISTRNVIQCWTGSIGIQRHICLFSFEQKPGLK